MSNDSVMGSAAVAGSKEEALVTALKCAKGYLINASIDLVSGAPKTTAMKTINGGVDLINAALKAAGQE